MNNKWFVAVAVCFFLTACGSSVENGESGDSEDDDEVATLIDDEVVSLSDAAEAAESSDLDQSADATVDPEQAALAFSQCMRDEGIDFPDVGIDAEGNVNLRESFEGLERDDDLRAAREACQEHIEAGGFGGRGDREAARAGIEEGLIAFTDCIRDEGFDVGDITLGGGQGQNQQQDQAQNQTEAEGDGQGQGQRQEGERERGFGNRQARLVEQLGLDAEDPEVQAALDTCDPFLQEAFANAPGRG